MTRTDTILNKESIELIIFDCDGVLIDSEILSKKVLLKMLEAIGANVSDEYYYLHFLGHSFEHVTKKVFEDYNIRLTEAFRLKYRATLMDLYQHELHSTLDVKWMLSQLNVPSCVATSGSPEKVTQTLKMTGLTNYFTERVYTASEVAHGKPAPDLFLYAAEKMNNQAEHCLVIEDSKAGINGALAAGMQVIKYSGASHMMDKNNHHHDLSINTIAHWKELFEQAPNLRKLQ